MTGSVTDRPIDIMAVKVHPFVGRKKAHVDYGMAPAETLEARHEPLVGEGIKGRHRERGESPPRINRAVALANPSNGWLIAGR